MKEGKMSKTIITPLINGLTSTTIHPERVKQIASIQYDTDDLRNGHILNLRCNSDYREIIHNNIPFIYCSDVVDVSTEDKEVTTTPVTVKRYPQKNNKYERKHFEYEKYYMGKLRIWDCPFIPHLIYGEYPLIVTEGYSD